MTTTDFQPILDENLSGNSSLRQNGLGGRYINVISEFVKERGFIVTQLNWLGVIIAFHLFLLGGCATGGANPVDFERKHYNSWEKDIGYVQSVRVGNTLYLSGITGDGETFGEQLESIYGQIKSILSDYGVSTNRISQEVIYTTDIELLKESIPLRKKFYPEGLYPSASWVQVAGLYSPKLMLEIAVTVELPL